MHIETEKKENLFEREREWESEAIQQAFTQKETVNDQSFQLFRSAGKSKYLFLSYFWSLSYT